jgi:hypothetical protein
MDEYGNVILKAAALAALVGRLAAGFIGREQARTGKTAAEIFADAGVQLDENELALIADLAKYDNPGGPLPV